MYSRALSMRWWLALAFAGIAALTALAVAQVFTARSESAIRERTRELVAGAAVAAAAGIPSDATEDVVRASAAHYSQTRRLALFAFARDGTLVTPERVRGISVTSLPNLDELLSSALSGRRAVETINNGRVVTVALPMRRGDTAALVAVASRSDLQDALGIVREQIVSAAIWATAIGVVTGLVVALLITRRLRRIANTAADIEQGRFDRELTPRFHDELGALAETIDRMRLRLRGSFDQLEGERDRLSELLEQLQEGVIAVDRNLFVEFANSRAQALLGRDLEPGRPLPEPWEPFSLRDAARSLFAPGARPRAERTSPDAATTFVVALVPPTLRSETGVVVITDISEQERRERAEREFVTNAAHELRTPLAAIASAVEVLQHGAKEHAEDRDRFLAVVERQTGRLTRLAHALLTLARAQTQSDLVVPEAVPLAPLVREVAQNVGDARVRIEVRSEGVEALAHRELLFQALENLTANARKHAPDAELTLRVVELNGEQVRIDVADTGPGMARQRAQRALDRFYRAPDSNGEGFGLGLPIVQEVVAAMGGTLLIESAFDAGTTVSIVLPTTASTTGRS